MIQPSFSPLFSSIITLYTLITLYSPSFFLPYIFSPVFFFTFILLLLLLRLGASQKSLHKTFLDSHFTQSISKNLDSHQNGTPKLEFLEHEESVIEELNCYKLVNEDSDCTEQQKECTQDFNSTQAIPKKLDFNQNVATKIEFFKLEESVTEEFNSNEGSDSAKPQEESLQDFKVTQHISKILDFDHNIVAKLDFLKPEESVTEAESVADKESVADEKSVAEEPNSEKLIYEDSYSAKPQQQSLQESIFTKPISKKLDFDDHKIAPPLDFFKPQESVTKASNSSKPIQKSLNSEKNNSDDSNSDTFVEWNVRAPLEVIYEANSCEEDTQNDTILEKYASLSKYYPETDTESSSSEMDFPVAGELSSPENDGFRWEEEGLIEIELYGKMKIEFEEENLIEIDLSPVW